MSLRILLLWDLYESHLASFLETSEGAVESPYADQLRALLADVPAWPPLLVPRLRELGHQADVLIGNAFWLQEQWCREANLPVHLSRADVLLEQIRSYQPDVLWIMGAEHYLGEFIGRARRWCRRVIAWRGVAWSPDLAWSGVDLVLTSHQPLLKVFQAQGIPAKRLLPCFEETVLSRIHDLDEKLEVVFVGSLNSKQFGKRTALLRQLSERLPLTLFVDLGWQRSPVPLLPWLRQVEVVDLLRRSMRRPAVFGLKMLSVLATAKLVINIHVDSAFGFAGNIRMFETTGVGTALLTEAAPNLAELFEPNSEVLAYRSAEEATEVAEYYLSHGEALGSVARAGQARTLRDHSARRRAAEFACIAEDLLAGGSH